MTNTEDMFSKDTQNKLREEYKILLKEYWTENSVMVDYCLKECDLLVKLDNGKIVAIEKPSIQTNFCFGYRLSKGDTEEFDNANAMARHAESSQDYFIKENLTGLYEWVSTLSDSSIDLYLINQYYSQTNDTLKKIANFKYRATPIDNPEYTPVTDSQREVLITAYKEEIKRFTKRLNTYLKRYGMSKVRTWSYWEDA